MDVPPIVVPATPSPPEPIARLTFPLYVRALALVTVLVFLYGLFRAPRAIRAGIEAERGRRDIAAGRYEKAAQELGAVLKTYPNSKDVRLDYAEALVKNGDLRDLTADLEWFDGKEVTKEENQRLDAIENEGDQQAAAQQATEEKK